MRAQWTPSSPLLASIREHFWREKGMRSEVTVTIRHGSTQRKKVNTGKGKHETRRTRCSVHTSSDTCFYFESKSSSASGPAPRLQPPRPPALPADASDAPDSRLYLCMFASTVTNAVRLSSHRAQIKLSQHSFVQLGHKPKPDLARSQRDMKPKQSAFWDLHMGLSSSAGIFIF